jgi:hypothetical protein
MLENICPYCKGALTALYIGAIYSSNVKIHRVKVPPPPYGKDLDLYIETPEVTCYFAGASFHKCTRCESIYTYRQGDYDYGYRQPGTWDPVPPERYNECVRAWEAAKRKAEAEKA